MEDSLEVNKPITLTDGVVSFTSATGQQFHVDVGGDVFLLDGTTANVWLNSLPAANSTTLSDSSLPHRST